MAEDENIERFSIESTLRQLFEQTLPERIKRYLEIKPHPIIANHHFSSVSTECIDLFRDGHFFGCVSLVQAVAEALAKFLCIRNQWNPKKHFEKNITKLFSRKFISIQTKDCFLQIWKTRDDYHHLNPNIEIDHQKLESMARNKLNLLKSIESDIFAFTFVDGKICPTNMKYWDIDGDRTDVYLRCT